MLPEIIAHSTIPLIIRHFGHCDQCGFSFEVLVAKGLFMSASVVFI